MAKSIQDLFEKYQGMTTLSSEEEEFIPSGMIMFDQVITGGKGIPRGKWIQISSESGCGKTHITLTASKRFCAAGLKVAYIDSEKGVNSAQLESLGVKPYYGTSFFYFPISTFEEAEDILDSICEEEGFGLIVIDSITDLIPAKCLENSVTSNEPGLQARAVSMFMKKYRAKISRTNSKPSVIMINQMRTKIAMGYGQQTTVSEAGGQAQKFENDIRVMMKKAYKGEIETTKDTLNGRESVKIGQKNEIWCEKTRYTAPFIKAPITVLYGKGVSNIAAYQEVLVSKNVLKMAGAGFWDLRLPCEYFNVTKDEPGEYEVDVKGRVVLKARGQVGVQELIKKYNAQCKAFIDANGGFSVVRDVSEEGDNGQ